jgi:guanylate kinase
MNKGKLLIFSAPSGSGKTTIVKHLLSQFPNHIAFSVSATTREKRTHEIDGQDYYFLDTEDFKNKIATNDFIEYEEVYTGSYYGTLKQEIERIWASGRAVIFDVDVEGGINLKKQFKSQALAVFVMPPSIKILEERLISRGTESAESLQRRVAKAEKELETAKLFDYLLINEDLKTALTEAEQVLKQFLNC